MIYGKRVIYSHGLMRTQFFLKQNIFIKYIFCHLKIEILITSSTFREQFILSFLLQCHIKYGFFTEESSTCSCVLLHTSMFTAIKTISNYDRTGAYLQHHKCLLVCEQLPLCL